MNLGPKLPESLQLALLSYSPTLFAYTTLALIGFRQISADFLPCQSSESEAASHPKRPRGRFSEGEISAWSLAGGSEKAQTPVDMSVKREGICAADCSSHRIITFQRDQIPVTHSLPRRASLVQRKELDEKWDCHDSVIAVRTPNRDCATLFSDKSLHAETKAEKRSITGPRMNGSRTLHHLQR